MCEHPIPCLDERFVIVVRLRRVDASSQGGTAMVRVAAVGGRATKRDLSSEGGPHGNDSEEWQAAGAAGTQTLDPAAPQASPFNSLAYTPKPSATALVRATSH